MTLLRIVTLVLLTALSAWPACAANRVALVIGNSGYRHAPELTNPERDAEDIGRALTRLGFEVDLASDLDFDQLRRALRAMDQKALGADMAVIYYAGHGIEVDRTNYMIPVDAQLSNDRAISYEAVPLDLALQAVAGATKLKLVIVDACRDNPFINTMDKTDASRSLGRGLGGIEPTAGTLVVYSAKEGTVALDGDRGGNSPFATALLSHLEEPGLEINFLFRKVRDDVLKITRRAQQPFTYGSLPAEEIYLSAPSGTPSAAAPANSPEVDQLRQELAAIRRLLEEQRGRDASQDASQSSDAAAREAPKSAALQDPQVRAEAPPTPERRAMDFIRRYNEVWSLPNTSALGQIEALYAERVNYYGNPTPRDRILGEKASFAKRWPERIYAVRWDTIDADCREVCAIDAVIDWYARSSARNASSSGAASVSLRWDPATGRILGESSGVLDTDRTSGTPSHILRHWHDENGVCRGGSGDAPETLDACERRNVIGQSLTALGWCHGRQGEAGYQHEWHRCGATSLR